MSSFYRFPAMAELAEYTNDQQVDCIHSEVAEARIALIEYESEAGQPGSVKRVCGTNETKLRTAYGMELMDVIHAAETALRMEFSDNEVEQLRDAVEEKNRRRGYYEVSADD